MYLDVIKPFDPWKSSLCTCPLKWVIHPYTGCSYNCLYCYASSYIPKHNIVRFKEKLIDRIKKDIKKLPSGALIELSSSSDPYPTIEASYLLTRKTLEILLTNGFKVLIVTKSTLFVRDLDILKKYRDSVVVSITITTLNQSTANKLEPNAPPPIERIKALEIIAKNNINAIVRIDPIVPYINDDYNELRNLIKIISRAGAKQITTSTYKAKPLSLVRIMTTFREISNKLNELYSYESSELVHGYRYLRSNIRFEYMKMVKEIITEEGLVFGTCREGFSNLNTPGFSCDGSTHIYLET